MTSIWVRWWVLISNELPGQDLKDFHLWDQTRFSSETKHLHFNEFFKYKFYFTLLYDYISEGSNFILANSP